MIQQLINLAPYVHQEISKVIIPQISGMIVEYLGPEEMGKYHSKYVWHLFNTIQEESKVNLERIKSKLICNEHNRKIENKNDSIVNSLKEVSLPINDLIIQISLGEFPLLKPLYHAQFKEEETKEDQSVVTKDLTHCFQASEILYTHKQDQYKNVTQIKNDIIKLVKLENLGLALFLINETKQKKSLFDFLLSQIKDINKLRNQILGATIDLFDGDKFFFYTVAWLNSNEFSLNGTDILGNTALMKRISHYDQSAKNVHGIKLLINMKADVNHANLFGITALMLAVRQAIPCLRTCILDAGGYVNATDINGKTASMYALEDGDTNAIHLLKSRGYDETIVDKEGHTIQKTLQEHLKVRYQVWLNEEDTLPDVPPTFEEFIKDFSEDSWKADGMPTGHIDYSNRDYEYTPNIPPLEDDEEKEDYANLPAPIEARPIHMVSVVNKRICQRICEKVTNFFSRLLLNKPPKVRTE